MDKAKKVATPDINTSYNKVNDVTMSVGNISNKPQPATKTSGITMRGAGAATKGKTCRGPMA